MDITYESISQIFIFQKINKSHCTDSFIALRCFINLLLREEIESFSHIICYHNIII